MLIIKEGKLERDIVMKNKIIFYLGLLSFLFMNPQYLRAEVSFFAMGDAPYYYRDFYSIYNDMKNLSQGPKFLIHLGDILPPYSPCEKNDYQKSDRLFKFSPVPFFW